MLTAMPSTDQDLVRAHVLASATRPLLLVRVA
jgi:hypothetical protein